MKNPKEPITVSFETAMNDLQQIVGSMEQGELPLEDLIQSYEKGMKLVKICRDKLGEAEQKIEVLTKTAAVPYSAPELKS
jgi:exodeoxyribonuclease VII small subunit